MCWNAVRLRDLDRAVARSVVDDLNFDFGNAVDFARHVIEHARERCFLVIARHLDNKLETRRAQRCGIAGKALGLDRPVHETHRQSPLAARLASREISAAMRCPVVCPNLMADRG